MKKIQSLKIIIPLMVMVMGMLSGCTGVYTVDGYMDTYPSGYYYYPNSYYYSSSYYPYSYYYPSTYYSYSYRGFHHGGGGYHHGGGGYHHGGGHHH